MGRLNRNWIPPKTRKSRLNRPAQEDWRRKFPKYPIMDESPYSKGKTEEQRLTVYCTKNGIKSPQTINVDVCLKSVLRFNPKSKNCQRCFGLQKGQHFPAIFTNAKKVIKLPETTLMIGRNGDNDEQD